MIAHSEVTLEGRRDQLSPAKLALLAKWTGGKAKIAPIPRRPRQDLAPLSLAQQRLWFLSQLMPGSSTYNLHEAVRIRGPLDPEVMRRVFAALLARHESLRTAFTVIDGEPMQAIKPPPPFELPLDDLREVPEELREGRAMEIAIAETKRPFNLEQAPLFRVRLVRISPVDHMLLWTMHHIVSDGWSLRLMIKEIQSLSRAFLAGRPDPLPPLAVQYGDFAAWERGWLTGQILESQLGYWRKELGVRQPPLNLPTDRPRPAFPNYAGNIRVTQYPRSLEAGLKALAREEGVTLFMVLLGAFDVMLQRYSGQDQFFVGSPIAHRMHADLHELVGFFANTIVLRADLGGDPTFRELLQRIQRTATAAYQNQDVPFERVVEELQPKRELNRGPFFDVMFVLQNAPMPDLVQSSTTVEPMEIHNGTSKCDLLVNAAENSEGLRMGIEYDSELFAAATIDRMLGHYRVLLEEIAAHADRRISALELVGKEERRELLRGWIAPAPPTAPSTLVARFEAEARRSAGRAAVSCGERHLSYAELNARANRLAAALVARGIGPGDLVAVALPRSLELIEALLGILKSGAAYLPLDLDYPAERLAYMLGDAGPKALLSLTSVAGAFPAELPRLLLDDPATSAELGRMAADDLSDRDRRRPLEPEHPAYVIYTSGSSGRPKGCVVTHRNVTRLFSCTEPHFGFGPDDTWTLFHSYAFDFSVWEIWGALLYGGRLVVVPYLVSRSPLEFRDLLVREKVTVLNQTPSAFYQLAQAEEECSGRKGELALRFVIFGGEALDFRRLAGWRRNHPRAPRLVNMYGITETTVHVTHLELEEAAAEPAGSLIGRAIPDLRAYVLGRNLELLPMGVPGQLYVAGEGLATGYLRRPGLTAERFIADPFGGPGERMYRTGDAARWRAGGALEYLGRLDHQVKIRGFRVELMEIESAVSQAPGVRAAAVAVREDTPGEKKLVAYVVPAPGGEEAGAGMVPALREHLKRLLPDHMIPDVFVAVPALPMTANGKIDRRALPAPNASPAAAVADYVAPSTPLEIMIAAAWAETLGVSRVGRRDNFFARGGHSLLAARMALRLRDKVGREVPLLRILFQTETLEEMAREIEAHGRPAPPQTDAAWPRMLEDSVLPEAIRAIAGSARVGPRDTGRALLTGATGFLGAFLLRDLLRETRLTVSCLVRAADPEAARRRLLAILGRYQLSSEMDLARVEIIAGDLAAPSLGLTPAAFAELAATTTIIYHCGAAVNFAMPYEQLRAANICGTVELLRLATTGATKPVHFVSTLHTLTPEDRGAEPALTERHAPRKGERLGLGYLQTKWVAERLVEAARGRGVPASIYRPGRISGDSVTGACQLDDFFWNVVRACLRQGSAPEGGLGEALAPVDYVSRAIVRLSLAADSGGETYHLMNSQPTPGSEMVEALREFGYDLEVLPYGDWHRAALQQVRSDPEDPSVRLSGFLSEKNEAEAPVYSDRETRERLAGLGVACPPVERGLLGRYAEYFARAGFFPPCPPGPASPNIS